ncbi:hypothetical protein [Stenotrophomonas rhizophila]
MRDLQLIHRSFSAARMRTFERAIGSAAVHPFTLYQWNLRISGAFLLPLHVCEVVIRNAVAEALEQQHGERWPWQRGFYSSLPGSGSDGYNARAELQRATARFPTTSSVIAALRFAFWQHMFTQRFDAGLWRPTLHRVLPGAGQLGPPHGVRATLHADLQRVRTLRNRIAHHEPVFMRDLGEDFATITKLVGLRCPDVVRWMDRVETVTPLLLQRPN